MEEGEAGALCVNAVCLQDSGLGRHGLLQPPLLAVRGAARPSFVGDDPVLGCCAWHRAHGEDLERAVDSTGASSGPSATQEAGALAAGSAPASESSAGCRPRHFQHCGVDSSAA